ncbi:MAG: glycosyltransferase [Alphaproteobacteria bacterium]|nr:glycosyltransferase [Alphaproteobacteria bacterium]
MKVLVWYWGKRGAGPRVAVELANGLRLVPGVDAVLSLSTGAEILRGASPPACELPVPTYQSAAGFLRRLLMVPFAAAALSRRLRALRVDVALCAMPAPLDLLMMRALRQARVPAVVVVHDADMHPGDGLPFQMALQRRQAREADALVALTSHVAARLREQGLTERGGKPLLTASLPPLLFGPPASPPGSHGGRLRLLSFGRLLPYKGLDLLADALRLLGPAPGMEIRVVGNGPESATLEALRALPGVSVENRWVPEEEVGSLLAWADALVLSHREASQSGVAAAAVAARRWVVSTRVGGLAEQLRDEPLARLCEPEPASLAAALRGLLDRPPAADPVPCDPRAAWRDVAESLVRQIEHDLLGRPRSAAALSAATA